MSKIFGRKAVCGKNQFLTVTKIVGRLKSSNMGIIKLHSSGGCYLCILPPANEVWGKVVFLHLSVCSRRERGVLSGGGLGTPSQNQKSGRYASYWNAFLYHGVTDDFIPQRAHKHTPKKTACNGICLICCHKLWNHY